MTGAITGATICTTIWSHLVGRPELNERERLSTCQPRLRSPKPERFQPDEQQRLSNCQPRAIVAAIIRRQAQGPAGETAAGRRCREPAPPSRTLGLSVELGLSRTDPDKPDPSPKRRSRSPGRRRARDKCRRQHRHRRREAPWSRTSPHKAAACPRPGGCGRIS